MISVDENVPDVGGVRNREFSFGLDSESCNASITPNLRKMAPDHHGIESCIPCAPAAFGLA